MSFADDQEEPEDTSFWKSMTVVSENPYRVLLETPDLGPEPEPEPQAVGYGRPPREHRFKPGQSGNPKGHRKGSRNKQPATWGERMREIVRTEAYREVSVRDGDAPVTMPMAQAVMRSLAVNAAKGKVNAQRLFLETVTGMEAHEEREHREYVIQRLHQKSASEQEIARRKAQGNTDMSDILPHPDHMIIDMAAGTVRVEGPETEEVRDAWLLLLEQKRTLEETLASLHKRLARQRSPARRADTEREIEDTQALLEVALANLPDWKVLG